jgi:hypothetical protein
MARRNLTTKDSAEVVECNAAPYGYPSKGATLAGGIAVDETGGAGWTVRQFPEEETGTGSVVVEVETGVLAAVSLSKLSAKLTVTKPVLKVKEKEAEKL